MRPFYLIALPSTIAHPTGMRSTTTRIHKDLDAAWKSHKALDDSGIKVQSMNDGVMLLSGSSAVIAGLVCNIRRTGSAPSMRWRGTSRRDPAQTVNCFFLNHSTSSSSRRSFPESSSDQTRAHCGRASSTRLDAKVCGMSTSRLFIRLRIDCVCTLALSQAPAGRWVEAKPRIPYAPEEVNLIAAPRSAPLAH